MHKNRILFEFNGFLVCFNVIHLRKFADLQEFAEATNLFHIIQGNKEKPSTKCYEFIIIMELKFSIRA